MYTPASLRNEERYGRLNYCSNGTGSSNSGTTYGLQQHEDSNNIIIVSNIVIARHLKTI